MPDRYVVRELEGDLTMRTGGYTRYVGLSCIVLDTKVNYRRVAEFRSEHAARPIFGGSLSREEMRAWARARAAELAARLNEATP
jgi:hypothetical protein